MVRGPRPSTGGWNEPRRWPDDWIRDLAPDARDPDGEHASSQPWNGRQPPGQARDGQQNGNHQPLGHEPFQGEPWDATQAPSQSWSADPSPGQSWNTDPSPSQPWVAGQPREPQLRSQPWTLDPSRPRGDEPPAGQPWSTDPSPSQPWGGLDAPAPGDDAEPLPVEPPGNGRPPGRPWGMPPAPGTLSTEQATGRSWGVQQATSRALEVASPGGERLSATAALGQLGRPGRGLGGNRRMALVIAIPLVISLLLLVTADPGRILPRKGARDAGAKPPAAAPVQPGDITRMATLVNKERARNGLPGMLVLRRLNAAAAAHSAQMARQKRIQADPGIAARVRPATSVSQYVDCASNVDQAFKRMLASATYRPLILSRALNGMGLGTVRGNCLWVTVLFARATPPASASKPAAPSGGGPLSSASEDKPVTVQATPGRPSSTAEAIAKDLFGRVNAERKARGLAPLEWSDDLARLATDWSGQMARSGRFVHRDLDTARSGPGIGQFSALGENIAWVRGYEDDGYELHLGWMRSDGHRRNLLQPGFDTIGIGVVCSGGRAWATQDFGRLSASAPPLSDSTPPTEPIVATAKDGRSC